MQEQNLRSTPRDDDGDVDAVVLQGGKRRREEAASGLARQGWFWCR